MPGAGFGSGFSDTVGNDGFGSGFGVHDKAGSALFNGVNNFLRIDISADFFPGTADYTVEWWQKSLAGIPSNARLFSIGIWQTADFAVSMEATAYAWHLGNIKSLGSYGSVNGSWHHFAVVRSGGVVKLYKDGTNISGAGVAGNENIVANLSKYFALGSETADGLTAQYNDSFKGHIAGFHLVVGSALYTGNFSTPSTPPGKTSNTKLLLNFRGRGGLLLDSGDGKHGLTNVSNVLWSADSPF